MNTDSRSFLIIRAVSAILLMIGFYVLALAVAAFLLLVAYLQVRGGFLNFYLLFLCLIGAVIIIWSILPRLDRFVPPGPPISASANPGLFAELRSVAEEVKQQMPEEVYLLPEVNAWVSQRYGFMGLGSRRVMGIGLPLLAVLTVPQFRAVIAHEFGHYYRGDTSVGPWIYQTRNSVIRTLMGLRGNSLIQLPFRGYAALYLRATQAISRRQEYLADELAAGIAGAGTMQSALRTIHGAGPAWNAYMNEEIGPVLKSGLLPPVASGFDQFLQAKPVAERVKGIVDHEVKESRTNPYDSHPSLKDRLAALGRMASSAEAAENTPALPLLENLLQSEGELMTLIAQRNHFPALSAVKWNDLVNRFYLRTWRDHVSRQATALQGLTPESLPQIARNLPAFSEKLSGAGKMNDQQRDAYGSFVLGASLALALIRQGWTWEYKPGEEVAMRRDKLVWSPFITVRNLAEGSLSGEAWLANCRTMGITGIDLANTIQSYENITSA